MDRLTLLPCPFCGSTDVDPKFAYFQRPAEEGGGTYGHEPGCNACGASAPAEMWNKRQSLSPEAVRDEALEEAASVDQREVELRGWREAIRVLKRDPNAAGQVPHGVCRADDPNREATSLPDGSVGLPQAAASACNIEASERGEAVSVSDDRLGTRIPAPAAPNYDDGDPAKWPPSGPAAPDVASMVKRLRDCCAMIGYATSGAERASHKRNADAAEAALLARLGQAWIQVNTVPDGYAYVPTGRGAKGIYTYTNKSDWYYIIELPPVTGASDE